MKIFSRIQHMGAAALIMAGSIFLSRFMGLIRDKVISFYYGAGNEADIYFAAFVIPDFINYLLAGGYFAITLIPLMSRYFKEDEADGWRFFSCALIWVSLVISALCLLAWILAPELAHLAAPGFDAESRLRLAGFLRIILPAQACFLPGACFTALLYYRRQFSIPALTPLIYNAMIIIVGLVFMRLAPGRGMEGFCWGVLAGAALGSLILPALAARHGGLKLSPVFRHPGLRSFVLLALPLMLGQSIVALDEQFVRIFGSLVGEGAVSLLNYARRIMLVPVGVVAQAAGVASFPFLARLAAEGRHELFNSTLRVALNNSLAVILPLGLWMISIAAPLMRLIFQQGRFSGADASESGLLLAIMLCGVGFWAVQQIIGRGFYAHEDTITPVLAGTAATALSLPLYWLLPKVMAAPGVALAGVLGVALYTFFLAGCWLKRFGRPALAGSAAIFLKACLFALPGGLVSHCISRFIASLLPGYPLCGAALGIAAGGLCFAPLYLLPVRKLAPELLAPLKSLARKKNKE